MARGTNRQGVAPRGKPALLRTIGDLPPLGPATGTDDGTIRDRQRMLAAVDESVGRILAALERAGQLDDTRSASALARMKAELQRLMTAAPPHADS